MNSTACRLPRVMVPVLSSSSVLTSPAASTARPLIASTLRCTSRSMPAMPMADSSAPIVVGIRQTTSAMSTAIDCSAPRVDRQRLQRHHGEQEDDGERAEQDVQRDLVRRLLPGGALDQGDHPVDEGLPRLAGDPDDDPVRQHRRPAGDGRAVAAGLADDRRGLPGDRRLVDAGDAVDDVAVARDDLAGDDHHLGAGLERGRRAPRGRRSGGRPSSCGPCAGWPPAPCRAPRRRPRRSWRTAR